MTGPGPDHEGTRPRGSRRGAKLNLLHPTEQRSLLRISSAALLGIHTLAYLTGKTKPIPATDIAEELRVPLDPLHEVLAKLVERGWLSVRRGPWAGYTLQVSPHDIAALEVMTLLDVNFSQGGCLFPQPRSPRLDASKMDLLHAEVRGLLEERLSNMTIADTGWVEHFPCALADRETE